MKTLTSTQTADDTTLLAENETLTASLATANRLAEERQTALTAANGQVTTLTAQVTELTGQVATLTAQVGTLTARAEAAEAANQTTDEAAAAQVAKHGVRARPLSSAANPAAATGEALATQYMALKGRERSAFYEKHKKELRAVAFRQN